MRNVVCMFIGCLFTGSACAMQPNQHEDFSLYEMMMFPGKSKTRIQGFFKEKWPDLKEDECSPVPYSKEHKYGIEKNDHKDVGNPIDELQNCLIDHMLDDEDISTVVTLKMEPESEQEKNLYVHIYTSVLKTSFKNLMGGELEKEPLFKKLKRQKNKEFLAYKTNFKTIFNTALNNDKLELCAYAEYKATHAMLDKGAEIKKQGMSKKSINDKN